jgi:hypothetical protein
MSRPTVDDMLDMFRLLSLDFVQPVLSDLGLETDRADILLRLARAFVLRWESAVPTNAWDPNDPVWQPIVDDTLEAIARSVGPDVAARVQTLASFESPGAWDSLLDQIARTTPSRNVVPLPFKGDTQALVTAIVRKHLGDADWNERLERVTESADSPWDHRIRRRMEQGAGEDANLTEDNQHPLAWTTFSLIKDLKVTQVLDEIGSALDADDRRSFLDWGRAQADALDIPHHLVAVPRWA